MKGPRDWVAISFVVVVAATAFYFGFRSGSENQGDGRKVAVDVSK